MQQQINTIDDNSISFKEIFNFLRRNRGRILAGSVLGVSLALIYLAVTPNSFEISWQMAMAQISNSNSNSNSNSEEPTALIQRLKSPTTFPVAVLGACDKSEDDVGEYLGNLLQVRTVKNVPNLVEFKLHAESKALATQCAKAITLMVIDQQREIIGERLSGRREQLAQYEHALKEEMQQLAQLNKSELGNFGYLAKLDKLSWLRTRIDALEEELFLSQRHPAKLMAPMLATDKPVAPKKSLILIFGLLLGTTAGLLYAITRTVWLKLNATA